MAEEMKNEIQDLSTKSLTAPSEEPAKESENAQEVVEKDEAGKAEDEGLVHVVEKAKMPTPPGKRPGPTTG